MDLKKIKEIIDLPIGSDDFKTKMIIEIVLTYLINNNETRD